MLQRRHFFLYHQKNVFNKNFKKKKTKTNSGIRCPLKASKTSTTYFLNSTFIANSALVSHLLFISKGRRDIERLRDLSIFGD